MGSASDKFFTAVGDVSRILKEALIHSPIKKKKTSLDPNCLDNFHLVCHLPFLGKMVEKVVAWQLQRILDEMDYLEPFQSGFRLFWGQKYYWWHSG